LNIYHISLNLRLFWLRHLCCWGSNS